MRWVELIERRFGLPAGWRDGLELHQEQGTVFVATPEVMRFDLVKPLRRGLRLCRIFPRSIKPTTWAMQVLGRGGMRNRVDVDEQQARELINGGEIELVADVEDGFVLVFYQGFVVGVGLYKKPRLKSQIPRFRPVD